MLTLITGAPGAGKTSALVRIIEAEVKAGRKCYVHDIKDLVVEHEPMTDDDALNWHEPGRMQDGSVLVFDEAHRLFPLRSSSSKVPAHIAALTQHRHRGFDVYVLTQHPGQVDKALRDVVGRHVHIVDTGATGRRWFEHNKAANVDQLKSWPVNEAYSLPKDVFGKYKSATVHVKPKRSMPTGLKVVIACAALALPLGGWVAYRIAQRVSPSDAASSAVGSKQSSAPVSSSAGAVQLQQPARDHVAPPVPKREPFAGIALHLAGTVGEGPAMRSWFVASVAGQRVGVVRGEELRAAGYSLRFVAPCVVVLGFGGGERVSTCAAAAALRAQPAASAPRDEVRL